MVLLLLKLWVAMADVVVVEALMVALTTMMKLTVALLMLLMTSAEGTVLERGIAQEMLLQLALQPGVALDIVLQLLSVWVAVGGVVGEVV